MKVYIVTDGCYSEYTIEEVFSNREAAEEYKKWHNITNDIEEYEVCDEPFNQSEIACMFIRVSGTVYPEAVVDIQYEIKRNVVKQKHINMRGVGISEFKKRGVFTLYNYHYIPANLWDEEKYKAKYTKVLYDLAGMAKAMFAEGASVQDVEQALINVEEKEVNEILL